jgi:hypothetical protein
MIKGVQRKMIMVKTDSSSLFETAYFVLRSDADKTRDEALDLLGEATRLVNQSYNDNEKRKEKKKRFGRFAAFCFFLLGVIFGAGSSALTFFILDLIR